MPVIATTLATEPKTKEAARHRLLDDVLRRLLPAANPQLERLFGDVRLWWVEVDSQGVPQREVGFNKNGQVMVAAPVGEDLGFWTDSPMVFSPVEHETVEQQAFESAWSSFIVERKNSHASNRGD